VAKSKKAPALFELIDKRANGKGAERLAVPKWFKGSQPAAPGAESPESATPADRPQQPQVSETQGPSPAPAASEPASVAGPVASPVELPGPTDEHPPVLRVRSGRIELSLNPVNAAIVAGVSILTLFCSYFIGQSVGAKSALDARASSPGRTDDIRQALNRPPDPGVLNVANHSKTLMQERTSDRQGHPSASKAGASPPAAGSSSAGQQAIINYVVVESFKLDNRKSAEYVQKWLTKQGLETRLERSGNRWQLVTTGGFNVNRAEEKAARDRLIEDLKSHGPACAEELRRQGLPEYWLKTPFAKR